MKRLLIISVFVFHFVVGFAQDTTRLSLLFLGDIMQHDSQISDAWDATLKAYNYLPCFQHIKPYTQAADLTIANLELTLAGPPYKGYPQFSAPDELLFGIKDMGIDILVTANNHCVDRGKLGLERTIQMLDSFNIPHTGTFTDEVAKLNEHPLLFTRNGFDLAILNYTYGTNGLPVTSPNIVSLIDTAAMRADLQRTLKTKRDAVIVFVHWGSEYQSLPSEWQKTVAKHCFKYGADLVIGAHPHVIQPMEWNKEKNQLVAYSLGNFISGQRKRYTDGGAMINVELEKVSLGPDSSTTRIDTANYILQWVYRTEPGKNYYMLPVQKFERDTTNFIADEESREALRVFAKDSRKLLAEHNKNVVESSVIPSDTLITYKVQLRKIIPDPLKPWSIFPPPSAGFEVGRDDDGTLYLYYGNFTRRRDAEQYLRNARKESESSDVTIVRFINGKRA